MFDFIISLIPIIVLLICLLVIKMPAKKASAAAFGIAMLEFIFWFRPGIGGFVITLEKGLAMGVFVALIAFGAMMLYNLVDMSGGFNAINRFLTFCFEDRFILFIMLCWVFSAFLQGIAGYGLPAVIATTILIKAGYDPVKSAAASLLGHSWAISFGSMGSSIYAIDMVTSVKTFDIVNSMAVYGSVGMLCCGLGVCFIYGGASHVLKGLKTILPVWAVMTVSLIAMARLEMYSVIGFVTGAIGVVFLILLYRLTHKGSRYGISKEEKKEIIRGFIPYALVIILSLGFYILDPGIKLAFSFPGYESPGGYAVAPEENYVVFNIMRYPFVIILITTIISILFYSKTGSLKVSDTGELIRRTWKKIYSTEMTLLFLLCTASIMMDSGMTEILSENIVGFTGNAYTFAASAIGMLGAFITGSNTNSNIMFGALQESAALKLGLMPSLMCAVQSISASVGGAIGPTTTSLASATAGVSGEESKVYRYTLIPTLTSMIVLGIFNFVMCL